MKNKRNISKIKDFGWHNTYRASKSPTFHILTNVLHLDIYQDQPLTNDVILLKNSITELIKSDKIIGEMV